MMNVLFVSRLTIDEELEEFSMSSVLRCDCINSSSLRDPALLLLVCQSCTQKRPSVYFFSCAYVKVRRVSLQLSILIQVIVLCLSKQSSASLMTSLSTCLHISGRAHKRWHQASCIALHNKSKQVLILTVGWCCDFHSVPTAQIERKEPVKEQINRFNQFLHNLRRRDWEYREAERQRDRRK